jgi:5-methylcytosine-specific restriction endonuclease McrA
MIQLTRSRDPQAFPAGLRGTALAKKHLDLLQAHVSGSLRFTSANSHWKTAKARLKAESHGKCAYCEAPTSAIAHGDVEHFRPKSVYWWLAYCYDNLLFSCQICNQVFKSDHFPVAGDRLPLDPPLPARRTVAALRARAKLLAPDPLDDAAGQPRATFLAACAVEQPDLVDPYVVDPATIFRWEADDVLREVRIAPREGPAAQRACAAAERFLGLNREELRRLRYQTFATLDTFRLAVQTELLPAALRERVREQLRSMLADDAPFAGMARFFVREVWQLEV